MGPEVKPDDVEVVAPSIESIFQMEEDAVLVGYAAICAERRELLDTICEPPSTRAEIQEDAERWEEYYEQEAAGLPPAEANILWHRIMASTFDEEPDPQKADVRAFFAEPVKPVGALEERYVEWRRDFWQRQKLEQLAADAVAARRENWELHGRLRAEGQTIEEMAQGPITFLSKLRQKMTDEETNLFLALVAPAAGKAGGKLSYEAIGELLGGITKQAVWFRVGKFQQKHPEAWAFAEEVRRRRRPVIALSALSPSERRKHGIEESYGDE